MLVGGALSVGVESLLPFHVIVTIGLFFLIVQGVHRGFLWVAIAGLLYETVSPFPPFVFLISLIATLSMSTLILAKYVSHRTFFGAVVVGAIGGGLYEFFTFLFSRLGAMIGDGWIPAFDLHYAKFILMRTASTAIALGILTLLAKRASPGVRGVMITHQR